MGSGCSKEAVLVKHDQGIQTDKQTFRSALKICCAKEANFAWSCDETNNDFHCPIVTSSSNLAQLFLYYDLHVAHSTFPPMVKTHRYFSAYPCADIFDLSIDRVTNPFHIGPLNIYHTFTAKQITFADLMCLLRMWGVHIRQDHQQHVYGYKISISFQNSPASAIGKLIGSIAQQNHHCTRIETNILNALKNHIAAAFSLLTLLGQARRPKNSAFSIFHLGALRNTLFTHNIVALIHSYLVADPMPLMFFVKRAEKIKNQKSENTGVVEIEESSQTGRRHAGCQS